MAVYEVEVKFSVADPPALRRRLADLGGRPGDLLEQTDRYYAHPCRDFAVTDEALRLRRDADGLVVTWKGPRIDTATKTRREIELPLTAADRDPAAALGRWDELLTALGFRTVREVRKRRQPYQLVWRSAVVEVVLDEVAGLGTFAELEQQSDAGGLAAARDRLEDLARHLECHTPERRSYLELLLAADGRA